MLMFRCKEHFITIRVMFNKKVSHAAAIRFAKNCVRGQEFDACIEAEDRDGWTKARIMSGVK